MDFNAVVDEYVKNTQSEETQALIGTTLDAELMKATQLQLDSESLNDMVKDLIKKIKEIPEGIVAENAGGCGNF